MNYGGGHSEKFFSTAKRRLLIIKIIDYKAGNAPSVMHAVRKVGFDADFAREPKDLEGATGIILPGVGSAGATMKSLRESGMSGELIHYVIGKAVPFLGVCVGMQVLFDYSEEDGVYCFGFLEGEVRKFDKPNLRVPQMGWNRVIFTERENSGYYYFVNSYYVDSDINKNYAWGLARYGDFFTAAVRYNNIYGTQFHIEKSGEAGLKLLKGFLSLC